MVYTPKISIVIPAYNASNYLAEAIESALAQTYSNVEIVVVNDGSKDGGATRGIALSYGDKIRYIEKENGGSSSALNMGIAHMTGEWFSWLSHDDLYTPDKLERQVAFLNSLELSESERSRHIFFAASEMIDAEGRLIRAVSKKKIKGLADRVNSFPHNGYLIAEPTVYTFHGCSCLVHRDAFADVGGFDESLRLLNDLDMWYRFFAADYRVHFIPEILVKGRVHGAQVSKSIGYSYHNPEQDMFWERSLNRLMESYPDENLFFRFGRNAYLKTRKEEGDRAFSYIRAKSIRKRVWKLIYTLRARVRHAVKVLYLKFKT